LGLFFNLITTKSSLKNGSEKLSEKAKAVSKFQSSRNNLRGFHL
jgi:hypothetical protein